MMHLSYLFIEQYANAEGELDQNGNPIIKGLSYMLIKVMNTFSNGAFRQTLTAVINPLGGQSALSSDAQRELENTTKTNKPVTGTLLDIPAANNNNASLGSAFTSS